MDEFAHGFDRQDAATRRLSYCRFRSASVCPGARHFHPRAISQPDREHDFVGVDYFQLLTI
jgi:hypothetical protein